MKYLFSRENQIEIVLSKDIEKIFSCHNHAHHYIISLCLEGSVNICIKNKKLTVNANEFFVIEPLVPHSVTLHKGDVLLSLCIDESLIDTNVPHKHNEMLMEIFHLSGTVYDLSDEHKKIIMQSLNDIYSQNLDLKNINNDCIHYLYDKLSQTAGSKTDLDSLALEMHISKYHLIRLCKNSLGLPPHKFNLQNRIRQSQKLLILGKPIIDVAVSVGFYDQSHFDRYFKKIVGISPKEYVRSIV